MCSSERPRGSYIDFFRCYKKSSGKKSHYLLIFSLCFLDLSPNLFSLSRSLSLSPTLLDHADHHHSVYSWLFQLKGKLFLFSLNGRETLAFSQVLQPTRLLPASGSLHILPGTSCPPSPHTHFPPLLLWLLSFPILQVCAFRPLPGTGFSDLNFGGNYMFYGILKHTTLLVSFRPAITFPIICIVVFVSLIPCSPLCLWAPWRQGRVCHCNYTPIPRHEKAHSQYLIGWVNEPPNAEYFRNIFLEGRRKQQIWNCSTGRAQRILCLNFTDHVNPTSFAVWSRGRN